MTYSEDHASPAPPFSGDGAVFDHPDMMLQAPTTQERVVDTQSGFLLVIKRAGERLALSCKRRVGTPPTSSILLTPDESLKLSKILASSTVGLDDSGESQNSGRQFAQGRRRFAFTGTGSGADGQRRSGLQRFAKPLIVASAVLVSVGLLAAGYIGGRQTAPSQSSAAATDPLSTDKVEKFARMFVADMLDFNPETYKLSQIQAMSFMSSELLEKYWKETNFPLTRRQLKSLPQGTAVVINKIAEERTPENATNVDIYADLVRSNSKVSNPLHIKLKLCANESGGIQVLEQEDLTNVAHE